MNDYGAPWLELCHLQCPWNGDFDTAIFSMCWSTCVTWMHGDVIKWKHFPRYWPFVRGIHWSPVNSPHKGQRRGAMIFSLIFAWINGWVNNGEVDDFRRHHGHYDVIAMVQCEIAHVNKGTIIDLMSVTYISRWYNRYNIISPTRL